MKSCTQTWTELSQRRVNSTARIQGGGIANAPTLKTCGTVHPLLAQYTSGRSPMPHWWPPASVAHCTSFGMHFIRGWERQRDRENEKERKEERKRIEEKERGRGRERSANVLSKLDRFSGTILIYEIEYFWANRLISYRMIRSVISTFSWGGPTFSLFFNATGLLKNWKKTSLYIM